MVVAVVALMTGDAIVVIFSESIEATIVLRVSMVVVSVEIRFSLISIVGAVVSSIDPAVVVRSAREDDVVDIV